MGRWLLVVVAALCALLVLATVSGGSSAADPVSPDAVPIAMREAGVAMFSTRDVGGGGHFADMRWEFAGAYGDVSLTDIRHNTLGAGNGGVVEVLELASPKAASRIASQAAGGTNRRGYGLGVARYRNLLVSVFGRPRPLERAEFARVMQALRDVAPA